MIISKYFEILIEKNDLEKKILLQEQMKLFESSQKVMSNDTIPPFTTMQLVGGILLVSFSLLFFYRISSSIEDNFFVRLYHLSNKKGNSFLDSLFGLGKNSSTTTPGLLPVQPGLIEDLPIPNNIHCLDNVMNTNNVVDAILDVLSRF